MTKSTVFPRPFVGVRWLENVEVVSHLLLILDDLKKFVDAVEDKTVKVTKGNSYENMLKPLKNIKLLADLV